MFPFLLFIEPRVPHCHHEIEALAVSKGLTQVSVSLSINSLALYMIIHDLISVKVKSRCNFMPPYCARGHAFV